MRALLANTLQRLALWLTPKTIPNSLTGGQWSGTAFVDAYKRNRNPTPNELMAELKNTAWACASINASVCASFPPRLYVATSRSQGPPRCATRAIEPAMTKQLQSTRRALAAQSIEEVVDHPLLMLFRQVNP